MRIGNNNGEKECVTLVKGRRERDGKIVFVWSQYDGDFVNLLVRVKSINFNGQVLGCFMPTTHTLSLISWPNGLY